MNSSDYSSDDSEDEEVRRNIAVEAAEITQNLAPSKSVQRYKNCYNQFIAWKKLHRINKIDEDLLLVYFKDLFEKLAPPTIWSRWSMLRTMLSINHNIEIKHFNKLKSMIKNYAKGHCPKKAKVFSWNEIKKFIDEAPDAVYLIEKVVAIFGIAGAMRGGEFPELRVQDIEDTGNQLIVTILKTKTDYPRTFVIGPEYHQKILQYKALRPENPNTDRFFLQLHKGQCVRQVIGKNSFGKIPKTIATYLNLPDPEKYTGHSFRRTSTTLLADSGASMTTIKQHGGWRSDTVASGYIENSIQNKKKIYNKIMVLQSPATVTHTLTSTSETVTNSQVLTHLTTETPTINLAPITSTMTYTITPTSTVDTTMTMTSPIRNTITSTTTDTTTATSTSTHTTNFTSSHHQPGPSTSKIDTLPFEIDSAVALDYFADDFPLPTVTNKNEDPKPTRPSTHSTNSGPSEVKSDDKIQNIFRNIPENSNIKFENCKFEFHFHYHGDNEN